MKIISIDSAQICADIENHGLKRMIVSHLLLPHLNRRNGYRMFHAWMKKNRMPKDKYEQLLEILQMTETMSFMEFRKWVKDSENQCEGSSDWD